jgi:hypothetical protein
LANESGDEDEALFRSKKKRPQNKDIGNRSLRSIYEKSLPGEDAPGTLFDGATEMSIL